MKKFGYRLQHLLNLRTQEEELVKLRLGQASRKIEEIDLGIQETHVQENLALAQYRNPRDMHVAQHYMIRMQKERQGLVLKRVEAEKIRQIIIREYTLARQKAEILRNHREKLYSQWRLEWLEYEDNQADDMTAARRLLQTHPLVGV